MKLDFASAPKSIAVINKDKRIDEQVVYAFIYPLPSSCFILLCFFFVWRAILQWMEKQTSVYESSAAT